MISNSFLYKTPGIAQKKTHHHNHENTILAKDLPRSDFGKVIHPPKRSFPG